MVHEKSMVASFKAGEKADRLYHRGEHLMNQGDNLGGEYLDKAERYNKASNYLEKRARRTYGQGHAMEQHGEGKPHGDSK